MIKKVTSKLKKTASRKTARSKQSPTISAIRSPTSEKLSDAVANPGHLFDLSTQALTLIDDALRIVIINRAFAELFGYSKKQIVGTKITDLLHPDELVKVERGVQHLLRKKNGRFQEEVSWLRRDGALLLGKFGVSVASSFQSKQCRAICWIEDVTEIRNTESELKRCDELLKRAERIAKSGHWEWDVMTCQGRWSEEVYRILGRNPDETRPFIEELFRNADPQERTKFNENIEKLIRHGSASDSIEYQILIPGEGIRLIQFLAEVVRDSRGNAVRVQGTIQDLTEKRELESQLQQSQKMEAVGLLAGGIAHDFNNLLTVIRGQCELLLRRLDTTSPGREEAESIEKSAEQAQRLTGQLLAFGRKQILETRVLDLNAQIARMREMLSRLIGEHIELLLELEPNLGRVRADSVQIEQVVLNLAINARDAMVAGGRLTIHTANVVVDDDSQFELEKIPPGRYAMLAVEDTGTGMDAATVSRVFEPFFTTKERGSGTGLGLATVYGIVRQSNGFLFVDSELGLGSVFRVYLPWVNEEIEEAPAEPQSFDTHSNGETILVVEDDSAVRAVAQRFLSIAGYQVLEAANGEEAIAIVENYPNPIDLVITDVVMPKMSGPETVERLKALRPDLRVLFVSGYPGATIAKQAGLKGTIPLLQKPYNLKSMTSKVAEILSLVKQEP